MAAQGSEPLPAERDPTPRATGVGTLCNAKGSDPEAGYNVGSINAPPCATRS